MNIIDTITQILPAITQITLTIWEFAKMLIDAFCIKPWEIILNVMGIPTWIGTIAGKIISFFTIATICMKWYRRYIDPL